MRQAELANQLGISKSYMSMIMNGQRRCPPELEQRLSSQKVVNFEAELSFARRKSGVRVSSAPPSDLAIEELSVRELLEVLLDDEAKRRLSLKRKINHELFALYYDHLNDLTKRW